MIEDTHLNICFHNKNVNINLGDPYLAEQMRAKIDKIIKTFR